MSVTQQTPYNTQTGNGVTTVFPYLFQCLVDGDLDVYVDGSLKTSGADYSVSGLGTPTGGNVTFVTPPANGTAVTIIRGMRRERLTDYQQLGDFETVVVNPDFDRGILLSQDLYAAIQRSIHVPDYEPTASMLLPPAAARANTQVLFDALGNITVGVLSALAMTGPIIGGLLFPASTAEIATGVALNFAYQPSDLRRIGLVLNSIGADAANTTAMRAYFNPAIAGPTGGFNFGDATGADTCYFNGNIGVRDGVAFDLGGGTLTFNIAGVPADNACGCFTAQRGFKIENGNLTWVFTQGTATSNYGNGLMFGGRATDVSLFPAVYDSLLASPMGKITVRNMKLSGSSGAGGIGRGIFMLGGLTGMVFENVSIDGLGSLINGSYYEYGWATNETAASARQTSHAHNISWKNLTVKGCTAEALSMNGAYGVIVDGLNGTGGTGLLTCGVGESRFYRPWVGVDQAGAKHAIHARGLIGNAVAGSQVLLTGETNPITAGYLGAAWQINHVYTLGETATNGGKMYEVTTAGTSAGAGGPAGTGVGIVDNTCVWKYVPLSASTDLLEAIIEDFALQGTFANVGFGIRSNGATRLTVRHGSITGHQRGVVTDTDCTNYSIDGVNILDNGSIGIQVGLASGVYAPFRQSVGSIRNCFIAGSGTSGASAAISVATAIALTVENCRFGYEAIHDDKAETTQLQAVSVATDSANVVVRNCYVAGVSAGNAFNLAASASNSRGCRLSNISGIQTTTGKWLTDFESATAPAIGAAGTIVTDGLSTSRVTTAGAVAGCILGIGGWPDQEVTVVHEGAAANTITMAVAGTSHVADGVGCIIAGLTARKFKWDSVTALWYRVG